MGQDCCTNRLKTQIFSTSRSQVDTTSAFAQTSFNPFKNSLSISFLYLLTGKQVNIQNSLKMILELAEQCSKSHICCYFDPDYLQRQHSLIEYQSPGSSFTRNNLAEVFWADLDYFYEEDICNEVFQFKVILLIETQGKGKHAISITRCMDPSRGNYFIVYDFLNRNRTYREKIFQDDATLNSYLNQIGEHFYVSYSPQPLSIKLLTFQYIDDKTESDIENLVNNNSQLPSNNNINGNINQISHHSIQSQQPNIIQQHSSSASIQQQQQLQQQGNLLPLHIQLQSLPSAQGNIFKASSISSIRSFQSLNQQGVSLPIKLPRNLSQNTPSDQQVGQLIQQQQSSQQFVQTTCQGSDQQFIVQLKQLSENQNYTITTISQMPQQGNQNYHIPTLPSVHSKNCGGGSANHHLFFNNNSQSTGIPASKCSCGFKQQVEVNQIENDQSWEHENDEAQNAIHYCSNHEMNYNQNADDVEILENGQCPSSASVQYNEEDQEPEEQEDGETPHSFNFQNNGALHCGAQHDHEDFLSDDASEIQICIQSDME